MFNRKLLAQLLTGIALTVGSIGMAQATLSNLLVSGNLANTIEDDSNEYIFRPNGVGGYSFIDSGDIQKGDVLLQIFDFPIVNNVNIDSQGFEVTGLALNTVETITSKGNIDPAGSRGPYAAVDIEFGVASAADWLALAGIDLGTLAFDTTGLFTLLYEDPSNNLDVGTQGLPTGLANAKDGTLRLGLSLTDPVSDFVAATNVPLAIDTFSLSTPGAIPGVSQWGTFDYTLSVAYQDIPGWNIYSSFFGSGNNLTTDRPLIAAVIDDTQATFSANPVPEPGSLALLSVGLLGFGFLRRRSVKS